MIINIDENLIEFLASEAEKDGVTPEVYIERKISAILLSRYRDSIVAEIESKKPGDVKTIKEAVLTISEAIRVRDYVEFPKIEAVEEPIVELVTE